ncbi:hypothetical protein Ahy_A04g017279 [Arachis hypogaea]|uniref:Disease resistance protein winged helix domain-containing protein n=1 Tax=Arachis hypogaea TaxID=3818 RepID=A0A445DAL3_ARAHY|nr:hypothetical protein Ahy_A04g017279 [Arachis hypogaea]
MFSTWTTKWSKDSWTTESCAYRFVTILKVVKSILKSILNLFTGLKLSYDSLPQRLKPCFLYFGMYPEDFAIPVKRLIKLWVAEGLIQPPNTGILNVPEVEDIAEEYLNELVMVAKRSDGGVKSSRIYYLLLDICISESKSDKDLEFALSKF